MHHARATGKSRGREAIEWGWMEGSAPASLDPEPAVPVVGPVARLPPVITALRSDPATRNPHVLAGVPAPPASHPDVSRSRSDANHLDALDWRRDAHVYPLAALRRRAGAASHQRGSQHHDAQSVSHSLDHVSHPCAVAHLTKCEYEVKRSSPGREPL